MSEQTTQNEGLELAETESLSPNKRKRIKAPHSTKGRMALAVAVVGAGALIAHEIGAIDIADLLNPNPGQKLGTATIPKAYAEKLLVLPASVSGSVVVHVPRAEQVWTDDDGTPHETQVFLDGEYQQKFVVAGKVDSPSKIQDKDLSHMEVILPDVKTDGTVVNKFPVYNEDESSIAFWQGSWQLVPGVDETHQEEAQTSFQTGIEQWAESSAADRYRKGVACAALAIEADKADMYARAFGAKVNIDRFFAPYTPKPEVTKGAPTLEFKIHDPANSEAFLTMQDCLPVLAELGFSNRTDSNSGSDGFGMPATAIEKLTVPARKG